MPTRDEHGRIFNYAFMDGESPTIVIRDGEMKILINMNDVGDIVATDERCDALTQEDFDAVFG